MYAVIADFWTPTSVSFSLCIWVVDLTSIICCSFFNFSASLSSNKGSDSTFASSIETNGLSSELLPLSSESWSRQAKSLFSIYSINLANASRWDWVGLSGKATAARFRCTYFHTETDVLLPSGLGKVSKFISYMLRTSSTASSSSSGFCSSFFSDYWTSSNWNKSSIC